MANFDSNHWYQIYVNERPDWSFRGTGLSDEGKTAIAYFEKTQAQEASNRWQIYSINSTTHVLRTQDGGPNAFLGTTYEPHESSQGQTRAVMMSGVIADASVYWTVTPWGDGTFYLTNGANGTAWNLKKKPTDDFVTIDSKITEPSRGQRWNFNGIDHVFVNDDAFSSVELPFASSTSASIGSPSSATYVPTTTPDPMSAIPSSEPEGLSTGAIVGIGVGVGGFVLVALLILGLFWWRHRRQHQKLPDYEPGKHELSQQTHVAKFEMSPRYVAKYEMPGSDAQSPVELPSNEVGSKAR